MSFLAAAAIFVVGGVAWGGVVVPPEKHYSEVL